jgi:acyl-CoA dehydrogenase
MSLDTLRALAGNSFGALRNAVDGRPDSWMSGGNDLAAINAVRTALDASAGFLDSHRNSRDSMQAGARGLAMTLARSVAAALLTRQATWSSAGDDHRPAAACRRFTGHGLLRLSTQDSADTKKLLG